MRMKNTLALVGAVAVAGNAQTALMTEVQQAPSNEHNHAEVFADLFGGSFSQSGYNFSNGSVDVFRVDDSADQTFSFTNWSARTVSRWAGAAQGFGTLKDGLLFSVSGSGSNVTGSVEDVAGGSAITFMRFGTQSHTVDVGSDPLLNPGGIDHAVTYTYAVDGNPVENTYLMFFEDRPLGGRAHADFDYNDLVVEITGQPLPESGVPEPSSMALLGLSGLLLLNRRRAR